LITASELAMFVRERVEPSVEATGRHQTPQLFTLDRHDHGEFVFQVPGGPLALPPAPTLTEDANPYRGLRSFLEADSDQFFGRGGITHQLVHSISERPLTVVVGPSGCGKSSVVHAGAVPALRANGWSVLATQRPASSPLRALAALPVSCAVGRTSSTRSRISHGRRRSPCERASNPIAPGWSSSTSSKS
jgi:hypothetical protein